ncbi:MAG: hypothetical protein US83_C0007G0055 [Candidatus Falkowbacteria bacterium GW2011_GWC2_38_22]|uniref:NTP pyrophosphohydrolase MazG-like domain-containing protein n=1 Tax=Candidatus Falkowbacteria bacterium GW2011_GWE1_38_31 TaxID=1618638 RepID=A0A0G0JTB5_9BACT|nr:MAG: hypothetical protein US73_C0008G0002 [Candidatus Falkowbacteria bacterium GW2011_GWF2_38_1205]KKQ61319.1 MAG: hypothetical protein US83_C0007G0055 [Candidatus Falkowbacteria bacterium GW2011_GWC2_38_22]KKQ63109.1 MAG: hypothetical protein US84_C0008G0002 [Candidatus Falkowbacteria bacterium GW2011_GWF1_38_22]KKQ65306.1 MAG: hypothetical protein US87_C0008G0002 [Candidatus Falkowbacteria bacterium GW2011_GWE2_38_254]KKQ69882.1 MAG: hypothetical protein US91_C0008G0002 [Candidatus Falkowb
MDFKELLQFIDKQDGKLIKSYESGHDKEKRVLARAVKLAEETGELCSEALSYNKNQRQEKLDNHSANSLANEVADVIITTMLLAKTTDVDIETALKNKIEKINKRFENI